MERDFCKAGMSKSEIEHEHRNYNDKNRGRESRKAGAQTALRGSCRSGSYCVCSFGSVNGLSPKHGSGDIPICVPAHPSSPATVHIYGFMGYSLHSADPLKVDCYGVTVPFGGWPQKMVGREILSRTEYRTIHLPDHFPQRQDGLSYRFPLVHGHWLVV